MRIDNLLKLLAVHYEWKALFKERINNEKNFQFPLNKIQLYVGDYVSVYVCINPLCVNLWW